MDRLNCTGKNETGQRRSAGPNFDQRPPPKKSDHPHRQRLDLARAPSRSARGTYSLIGNTRFDNLLLTPSPKAIHPGSHPPRGAQRPIGYHYLGRQCTPPCASPSSPTSPDSIHSLFRSTVASHPASSCLAVFFPAPPSGIAGTSNCQPTPVYLKYSGSAGWNLEPCDIQTSHATTSRHEHLTVWSYWPLPYEVPPPTTQLNQVRTPSSCSICPSTARRATVPSKWSDSSRG